MGERKLLLQQHYFISTIIGEVKIGKEKFYKKWFAQVDRLKRIYQQ